MTHSSIDLVLEPTHEPLGRRWHPSMRVIAAVLALFVALIIPAPLHSLAQKLLQPYADSTLLISFVILVLMSLTTIICVLLIKLLTQYADRRPLRATGWFFTRSSGWLLLLGMLISIAIVVGVGLTLTKLGFIQPGETRTFKEFMTYQIPLFAMAFLLQGIPEELIFRGYIMQTLGQRPKLALFVSVVIFGILHLASNGGQENFWERVLYLANPLGFAFIAGALVLQTRSLWPAIGIHGGFHVGSAIGMLFGIGDGPVMWVSLGIVYSVVAIIIYWRWLRDPNHSPEVEFRY